ncbi:cytochrome P450 [Amycolatopsis jejuensis]|uniref:cytochrome P450 n=1 Tax=Amycolatopsis jejuensis TaxID=330084 RepID=UPI0006912A98|nr:cytochrome P450 [Amycolatopsis jejuensis]
MSAVLPGPRLSAAVQTALYWASPRRTVRRWQAAYGDVIGATVHPMGQVVFLCRAGDIKDLMRADPATFRAGAANAALGGSSSTFSLLTADGPQHTNARALLMPAFHGRAVRAQVEYMAEITDTNMATWPVGRPFALHRYTKEIALDVILRVVMGIGPDRLAEVRAAMLQLSRTESAVELALGSPVLARLLPYARRRERHLADSHRLLQEIIAAHRDDPALDQRVDALALLVGARGEDGKPLSDREIEEQLITLLVAGYETTAAGLAWTFEQLVRTPSVLAKAASAADTDDDEYLDALVKESLRLRTVVPDLSRMAMTDVEFAGHRIAAGSILTPCLDVVHESPSLFGDAGVLRPERFLEDKAANWLPFGGGIRRCLGATFALVEMRTVIKQMLRRFSFSATSAADERFVRRHITSEPGRGAMVTVQARAAVAAAR